MFLSCVDVIINTDGQCENRFLVVVITNNHRKTGVNVIALVNRFKHY